MKFLLSFILSMAIPILIQANPCDRHPGFYTCDLLLPTENAICEDEEPDNVEPSLSCQLTLALEEQNITLNAIVDNYLFSLNLPGDIQEAFGKACLLDSKCEKLFKCRYVPGVCQ